MDLSVIVVNYKTPELTLAALESVMASQTDFTVEVILIDNASHDGCLERVRAELPSVSIIANAENLGFSTANNQGIRAATGRYVLLLNSDTVIPPDCLQIMLVFMEEQPRVGASGCKIVLPDGSLDPACKRGFPTPAASFYYFIGLADRYPRSSKYNYYHMGQLDADEAGPVDCLMGAFLLVRREAIEQVGLLDESFFMYGEDIDWCYRFKEAGWGIQYYPQTTITHYKRASSHRKPVKLIYEFHRAMYLFYRKHYRRRYPLPVTLLMYAGIAAKLLLSLAKNKLLPPKPGGAF